MIRFQLTVVFCALIWLTHAPGALAEYVIDTVAGNGDKGLIGQPFGVEIGPDGALYVCEVENHRISRMDLATGKITIVAGNGTKGYSGDGGPATKASLNEPYEIRFDADGNFYFVEMKNHLVRFVNVKTGVISTVAGTGKQGYGGDGGPALKAKLNNPHSIALDKQGNLYIADISNNRIRRVTLSTGRIETIAGTGEKKPPVDGSVAKGKSMFSPRALFVVDRTLWIALRNGHSVWTMDLDSFRLKHIAGSGKKGFTGDGGSAKSGTFNGPKGIAVGPKGNVYVVDTENQTIRMIDPKNDRLSTVAGIGPSGRGYGGDNGPATKAKMDRPHGVCVDVDGTIYIGDTNTHRVRRVRLVK